MGERKFFPDSVVQLPAEGPHAPLGLTIQASDAARLAEPMTVHFAFGISPAAQTELETRVAKGEVISPQEQAQKYQPAAKDISALQTWLKGEGFTITHVAPDGIYAQAPASQVAKSLGVDMVRVTRDGFTHNAARNAPSLRRNWHKTSARSTALQPFLRAHRHNRRRAPKAGNRASLGQHRRQGSQ